LRSDLDNAVRDCVIALQGRFGARIQQMLAQHRRSGVGDSTGGLLVVLDHVDTADDQFTSGLSEQIPVALIDRRTLESLSRLGDASPIADAEPLFAADTAEPAAEPRLLHKARGSLEAVRLLLQQGCPEPAVELMTSALLAAAAHSTGQTEPPSPAQAGIWLYGEMLPAGLLEQEDAALLMRAVGLAQGGAQVPESLLTALADDAEAYLATVSEQFTASAGSLTPPVTPLHDRDGGVDA
jgi:hypothetical protein